MTGGAPNPFLRRIPDAPRDPEAFLRWSAGRDGKHELVDGEVISIPFRATRGHARVVTSALVLLAGALRERGYVALTAFAVRTPTSVLVPDLLVEPAGLDGRELASANPILIVEVLSPSSLEIDFVQKRAEYTAIPSLRTYLILAQDEPRAWAWTRGETGWPEQAEMIDRRDAEVPVPALGLSLPLARIYRGIGEGA